MSKQIKSGRYLSSIPPSAQSCSGPKNPLEPLLMKQFQSFYMKGRKRGPVQWNPAQSLKYSQTAESKSWNSLKARYSQQRNSLIQRSLHMLLI